MTNERVVLDPLWCATLHLLSNPHLAALATTQRQEIIPNVKNIGGPPQVIMGPAEFTPRNMARIVMGTAQLVLEEYYKLRPEMNPSQRYRNGVPDGH